MTTIFLFSIPATLFLSLFASNFIHQLPTHCLKFNLVLSTEGAPRGPEPEAILHSLNPHNLQLFACGLCVPS